MSAGIEIEYLNVCHIVECHWHCASISRYYGSISIFLRIRLFFLSYEQELKYVHGQEVENVCYVNDLITGHRMEMSVRREGLGKGGKGLI